MLKKLFDKYKGSIAYVSVQEGSGDNEKLGIGTSFHVGNGVFVTAKHVVENKTITQVATTKRVEVETEQGYEYIDPIVLTIVEGPLFPKDSSEDIAIFKVDNCPVHLPAIPLGNKDNLSLKDSDYVLSKAIVMGYPPIPMTRQPHLLTVSGEVNALIDLYHSENPHFVISALSRGGFSGGVVLSEFGHAIGLVTESLLKDDVPAELGFMSVLNVEVIHKCVTQHFEYELVEFGVFYDSDPLVHIQLTKDRKKTELNERLYNANIRVFDDGTDVFIELSCSHSIDLAVAYAAFNGVVPLTVIQKQSSDGYIFAIPKENASEHDLIKAATSAKEIFENVGYLEK
ncbi:hypothetical protein ATY37_08150 [Vibrio cidicii]|uniref:Serine protease n=1 Tax=Vibrio cidicii TaxID=1763883 RepID=A0A151KS78_9VIBR|nr:serine protease [Vibrio cidicii]KYN80444.1 hypothetical protein ATY37_08150 [Vibrio cidicii]